MARQLGHDLARAGVTVVSGMARGIDTAAHQGALQAGGYTIAVLGCGVDVVYPRENKKVMQDIAATGAVISEFPPGSAPDAWHFPVRNRIISGLSRCVAVIEAAERSGALITADVALEQGRDVLAVPGNVSSRLSKGTNGLIKQGAKLVEDASDILEELGLYTLFPVKDNMEEQNVKLSATEEKIFNIIYSEPMHLDEIIAQSHVPPGEVLSLLMYLEMKGVVKQLPGKMFVRV
jgi:DNA processing protein